MMSADEDAEHPAYVFVFFHEAGDAIAGAGVAVLAHGGREVGAERADEGLVVAEQIGQRGLGLGVLAVTSQTPGEDPRARRVMTENGLFRPSRGRATRC